MVRMAYRIMGIVAVLAAIVTSVAAQTVPQGINYQAVARDFAGKELSEKVIDVRFSIMLADQVVYRELHQSVRTSKYGVFTLMVGSGMPVGGTAGELSQVNWSQGPHSLKVEIKFTNDFTDMGTMQFTSVPYALYAGKSLEAGPTGPPGPAGPTGPPGDPASDKQTLSFNGTILTISGSPGNWVDLTALINDTDSDPTNEIQDLELIGQHVLRITRNSDANPIDLARYDQRLLWNTLTRKLVITNSTDTIDLSRVLSFNSTTNTLSISGGNTIDLSSLVNDADSDPTNELITNIALQGSRLVITEGGAEKSVDFSTNMVTFRAKKLLSTSASSLSDVVFTPSSMVFNDGDAFNSSSGDFIAPSTGIYTFNVSYFADGPGGSRKLSIYLNSSLYEDLAIDISSLTTITNRSITMRLTGGDIVRLVINTGTSTQTGTGTFSGFRVY